MPASLTRPLPFTVLASDEHTATAPARNTLDDRPGKVWRTTTNAGYIVIDLGTAAYDTVVIVGTNLTAADTVRIRTGTDTTAVGAFDRTVPAMTGTKPTGFTTKTFVQLGQTRSERYMRIDFVSAAPVEVQRIVVGPSVTTIGIDHEADEAVLDSSEINTVLGVDTIQTGLKKLRWKFSMSRISESDWRNSWKSFLYAVGKTQPVVFVPFVETPSSWQSDITFGRIRNDVSAKIPGMIYRVVEMTVEGISI